MELTNDEKARLIVPLIRLVSKCNGITNNGNACKVSIGLRMNEGELYCPAHYKRTLEVKVKGKKCLNMKGTKQCGNSGLYDGYCRFHKKY